MPYPVLPPDLPPVVQTSQPESSLTPDPSSDSALEAVSVAPSNAVATDPVATGTADTHAATSQAASPSTESQSTESQPPESQPVTQSPSQPAEHQASSAAIQAHVSLRLPDIATPEIFSPHPTQTPDPTQTTQTYTQPDDVSTSGSESNSATSDLETDDASLAASKVETSAHSLGQPITLDVADFAIAPSASVPAIAELRSQLAQAPLLEPRFSSTPLSTDFGSRSTYSPLANQTVDRAFSQALAHPPESTFETSFTPPLFPGVLPNSAANSEVQNAGFNLAYLQPNPISAVAPPAHSFFPSPAPGEVLGRYLAQYLAQDIAQAEPDGEPLDSPDSDRPVLEIPTTPPDETEDGLSDESADETTEDSPSNEADPDSAADGAGEPTVPVTLEESLVELRADRQEYDTLRRIFEAEGNVVMRYGGGILDADRLRVNLVDRIAVAEGNVALTRGDQVIRGDFFEYNFVQGTGAVTGASGEIFLPTTGEDLAFESPGDPLWSERPLSDRIRTRQAVSDVRSTGQLDFGLRSSRSATSGGDGEIRRLRFEADSIEFDPNGWVAQNIRITNDPFSPPELELRAREARLNRIDAFRDEVRLSRPRLVLDQGLQIPILRDRIVLDRRERNPSLIGFGFDEEERGGFFVEGNFEYFLNDTFRLYVKPQIFVQRAFDTSPTNPDAFGVVAGLDGPLAPRTYFSSQLELTSLDFGTLDENLRARATINQAIPLDWGTHNLSVQYIYRDRLFNGSLGFQNVQESFGAVFTSPRIVLGDSGFGLRYQASAQLINANTNRLDLLEPDRTNNRVRLGRFQASASLDRSIFLWQGEALPPTPEEGLRFTPRPLVPNVALFGSVLGVLTEYTSGDSQNVLRGVIGLRGQFGHLSRDAFDYTAFTVSYSDALVSGQSPFLFDRLVDERRLQAGFTQQLFGPFLFGVQTSINLNTGREISTSYILEYSRRTYGIVAEYNPVRETGSISLRINDFNWNGTPAPFDGGSIRDVDSGVIQTRD